MNIQDTELPPLTGKLLTLDVATTPPVRPR
jgi:hypothetical protein